MPGTRGINNSTSAATASTRCSQLSSTSSSDLSARKATRLLTGSRVSTATSSAPAIADGSRSGLLIDARSTKQCGRDRSSTSALAARATEVLPTPPGPAMVIRRCRPTCAAIDWTISSRPIRRWTLSGAAGAEARAGGGISATSERSTAGVNRYPRPATLTRLGSPPNPSPSNLRSAAIWTRKLLSSTNVWGHAVVIRSSLETTSPLFSTSAIRISSALPPIRTFCPSLISTRDPRNNANGPKRNVSSTTEDFWSATCPLSAVSLS